MGSDEIKAMLFFLITSFITYGLGFWLGGLCKDNKLKDKQIKELKRKNLDLEEQKKNIRDNE